MTWVIQSVCVRSRISISCRNKTTAISATSSLFLEDKIGFLDIGRLVEAVVDSDSFGGDYTLADVYECDKMARAFVRAHL